MNFTHVPEFSSLNGFLRVWHIYHLHFNHEKAEDLMIVHGMCDGYDTKALSMSEWKA